MQLLPLCLAINTPWPKTGKRLGIQLTPVSVAAVSGYHKTAQPMLGLCF